ncbi:MAG: hypothetical protein GOVbin2917_118 [Prokaryotic dsDNA virus sp.]|jgi:predicted secreted protein|nr:MAG: hypothetical protein GOVbin2917_118 [Prokaryotic dsDNA virus sp.]|tara:strand:+ start:28770 stop:28985 length:216 start_codon:yes stop_codon:yes gene_type:complete
MRLVTLNQTTKTLGGHFYALHSVAGGFIVSCYKYVGNFDADLCFDSSPRSLDAAKSLLESYAINNRLELLN